MTGPQHTRYLIACRLMSCLIERYSVQATIGAAHFYVYFTFPINVKISSSMLSEWSDIIGRYRKIGYELKVEDGAYKVIVQ